MPMLKEPLVFAEDLNPDDSGDIKEICERIFRGSQTGGLVYSSIASQIREEVDRRHNGGWNCVVGRSFGAFVTQKLKCYIYLSVYQGVSILLWKA